MLASARCQWPTSCSTPPEHVPAWRLAADADRYLGAGRLLGAATQERERLGYVRFAVDQADVALAMGKMEAALGASGLTVAWSECRADGTRYRTPTVSRNLHALCRVLGRESLRTIPTTP